MTKNESFKRKVRQRMAATGERYAAARKVLLDQADPSSRSRTWVSEPEFTDEVIRENTGRTWEEWCQFIEAWPGHTDGHTAIAAYVHKQSDITHWWSQGVTVGYERIVGLRLPGQRSDGLFAADKSKTISVDADRLREMLLDEDDHPDLFGGLETELRSKPTSKSIRIRIGPGSALFTLEPKGDGRTKVVVSHEKLPAVEDVDEWKFFWGEWLDALDES